MIKLGITGGIGSGKSYVSRLLEERGMPLYDTDSRAKLITVVHPSVKRQLTELLGPRVYAADGSLNKPVLASYLFACEENARKINAIIHPKVLDDFRHWAACREREGHLLVGMESAILFESGFDCAVDKVLMVYAPADVRMKRVMDRDGVTEVQVKARMNMQEDDEEKSKKADFVVMNDGISSLGPQLDSLLEVLVGRKELA